MASKPDAADAFARLIAIGKDVVALLRDGALFLLAILLVVFPARFNDMLQRAGFREGSIAGFTWQSTVGPSDSQLGEARDTIEALRASNAELAAALAVAQAKVVDPSDELSAEIARLQSTRKSLDQRALNVETRVDQALIANAELLQSNPTLAKTAPAEVSARIESRPAGDYQVGYQTVGLADSSREAINKALRDDGYRISPVSASYPERPTWFASRPTVFYYDSRALPAANALAERLSALAGRGFAVQRGAGLGVEPSLRDVTLYAHDLAR